MCTRHDWFTTKSEVNMTTSAAIAYTPGDLPLCSPRKTNLNFLNGFPNSPEELIVDSYVWTEN